MSHARTSPRFRPIRLVRILAAVAVTAGVLVAAPTSAMAHTELESTSPADGAVLSEPPATVSFTFNEELLPGTDTISVNDDAGNVVATAAVEPVGATISMPWPAEATSGTFQVAFRVVSADGHPVSGAITLTLSGEPGAGSTPAASTAPDATPSPATTAALETPAPAPTAQSTAEPRGIAAWLVVVLALIVLALIVFVAVALIHRRG